MGLLETKIIKHAVFDAYGTLFDVHSAIYKHQSKLGEKATVVSELWRRKQLEYTWLRNLIGKYVDFRQVTSDALEFAFDSYGICDNNLKKDLINSYQYLACYSEVPTFLSSLKKKGFGMYVLSNGTYEMLEKVIRKSGLEKYFDEIFSVDTIKIFKPDPKVYEFSAKKLKSKPRGILFFSSNSWDISGASSYGYQAVWVNRFQQKFERLPGRPILETKNLKSVLKFIN